MTERAALCTSSKTKMTVDVEQLLLFFDEDATVGAHANAVKAVIGEELGFALLLEYFRRQGIKARMGPHSCTTGKTKGHRLDGWVVVTQRGSDVYFQVEVKTWSHHSVGGRRLPVSATAAQIREFKKERWKLYWTGKTFAADELRKVLGRMRPPISGAAVEPIACVWDAMHPTGGEEPYFTVPLPHGRYFDRVHIFSMSSFLRDLGTRTLELNLPCARERLDWLLRLFPFIAKSHIRARSAAAT